jgi:ligand-binding sensor domain-containing protein
VVFALVADDDNLWAGTEHGLALYRDGEWTSWGEEDGLVYPVITSLAVDPATGDLWIGTMGGVSRFSGGAFENFTQNTSGLANDVVYAVAVAGRYVWAATAAGASRYDTWDRHWEIFTNTNAPMHEIWCYGLTVDEGQLYMAVWGGGVLRWDRQRERWRDFRDPDGELELDLLRDDGPVSDVVASVSHADGVLWAGTYFGVNRYDGRRWSSFAKEDSPLVSNFVNFVRSEGTGAWLATDLGLVLVEPHADGFTWTTYRRNEERPGGTVRIEGPDGERVLETRGSLPANFVLSVVRRGDEVWAGTEDGLAVGTPAADPPRDRAVADAPERTNRPKSSTRGDQP